MRRYVYRGGKIDVAALQKAAPSATITASGGEIEIIIPDKDAVAYDRNQPCAPDEVDDVPDTATRLTVTVRADLFDALVQQARGAKAPAGLVAAVDAVTLDATTRKTRS